MTDSAHFRRLEAMYQSAPINQIFQSQIQIKAGEAEISCVVQPGYFHSAGAAHGTFYFKLLDDACFFAVNALVPDVFILTTAFNLNLTRPIDSGTVRATGRHISGKKRVFVAEAILSDEQGDILGRGSGTFMRSKIPLAGLDGYRLARP